MWPQARTAVIEKRETLGGWSSTPQKVEPQALEQYDMRREADARVAGHDVAVFLLEPRDGLRYAQRLWADLGTGLMLRADVLAGAAPAMPRAVLESTAFSEVSIGVRPQPEMVTQSLQGTRKLDGYRVLRPQQQRTVLEVEGWSLSAPVAGFRLAGCVRRGMDVSGDDEPVLQAVFSDGLTHVSLFVEATKAQRPRSEMQGQHGATATLTQRRGDHWFTPSSAMSRQRRSGSLPPRWSGADLESYCSQTLRSRRILPVHAHRPPFTLQQPRKPMNITCSNIAPRWAQRMTSIAAAITLACTVLPPGVGHAQAAPTLQLPDFTELVERVGPSVVNIRTTEKRGGASAGSGEMDPNLEEFFRRFGIPLPNRPNPRQPTPRSDEEPQQRGVGSGFILSGDGYIMTNAHVVDGAEEVIVRLTDKREFKARIIGADKRSDVAVVKVEAAGLPFVKIGDVNRLKVGEWVMAIGSPFDLDNTVTAGIVSAKQRDTGDSYLPLIQTDVAINPGNSGGPLINLRGEVVGINSQIYSRSGGYMGISFAIPDRRGHARPSSCAATAASCAGASAWASARSAKTWPNPSVWARPAVRWSTASRRTVRQTRPVSKPATSSSRSTASRSRSRATCRASSAASSPVPVLRCRCSAAAAPRN